MLGRDADARFEQMRMQLTHFTTTIQTLQRRLNDSHDKARHRRNSDDCSIELQAGVQVSELSATRA